MANNIGLKKIRIVGASDVTIPSSVDDFVLEGGTHWTVAFNGKSCDNTTFIGAIMSGVAIGELHIINGHLGDVTMDPSELHEVSLDGDIIFNSAGNYNFDTCRSGGSKLRRRRPALLVCP